MMVTARPVQMGAHHHMDVKKDINDKDFKAILVALRRRVELLMGPLW